MHEFLSRPYGVSMHCVFVAGHVVNLTSVEGKNESIEPGVIDFVYPSINARIMFSMGVLSPGASSSGSTRRDKASLESFHDNLANFANTGMGHRIADAKNLLGTSGYNYNIRHRIFVSECKNNPDIIQFWLTSPSYKNDMLLSYVNDLAKEAGCDTVPYPNARVLPPDNGERFFAATERSGVGVFAKKEGAAVGCA